MAHIKIDRKILEWRWYSDINTCRLWLHLLIKANWKDGYFKNLTVTRGSFVSSIKKLSDETFLTPQEVRTALAHLKSTGEITVKSFNRFSLFTINNYNQYQSVSKLNNNLSTDNQHSINTPSTPIEELKELEENNNYTTVAELFNSICKSYPAVKKISADRQKNIADRLAQGYLIEDFKQLFITAENNPFLKGDNARGWKADFDWLIKDKNMAKVLDGNYNNNPQITKSDKKQNRFVNYQQRNDWNFEEMERQERELVKRKLEECK